MRRSLMRILSIAFLTVIFGVGLRSLGETAWGPNLIAGSSDWEGANFGVALEGSGTCVDWWYGGTGQGKIVVVPDHPPNIGTRSLCFDASVAGIDSTHTIKIDKRVDLHPNGRFLVSAWVKNEGATRNDSGNVLGVRIGGEVFGGESGWEWKRGVWGGELTTTDSDWTFVSFEFNTGPDEKALHVAMLFIGPGKGYFDNISVQEWDEIGPNTPVNCSYIRNGNNIQLSWQVPARADDGDYPRTYNIYRSTNANFTPDPTNRIGMVAQGFDTSGNPSPIQNSFTDTVPTSGRYYYIIRGVDETGNESGDSERICALGFGAISGKVTCGGNNVGGARVEIVELTRFVNTEETTGNYSFTNVVEGEYTLRVKKPGYQTEEINVQIIPEQTLIANIELAVDDIPPQPPENLRADISVIGAVRLTWDPPAQLPIDGDLPVGYVIYRSNRPFNDIANAEKIGEVTTNSYFDGKVSDSPQWYYAIVSLDDSDNFSGLVFVHAQPIPAPSPKTKQPGEGTSVASLNPQLEWEGVEGNVTYTLEYSQDPLFPQNNTIIVNQLSQTTYPIPMPLNSGKWYWRVRACFANGVISGYSEVSSFVAVDSQKDPLMIPYVGISPQVITREQGNARNGITVSYVLKREGIVDAKIYDTRGRIVYVLEAGNNKTAGAYNYIWYCCDEKGNKVPNGLYLLKVEIRIDNQVHRVVKKIGVFY